MYQDHYVFSINYSTKSITILQKCNYFHICNILNQKFETFTGLESFTIFNEDLTFQKRVNLHPKYIDKYLSNTIDYINNLKNDNL